MILSRYTFATAFMLLLSGPSGAAPEGQTPEPVVEPAQALRTLRREHDALLAQQPALQEAAARTAELADQNQQLEQQVQGLQTQVDGLREETTALRSDDRRLWFITGAAVLGAGLLLGLTLSALRGRSRRGRGGFR